MGEYRFPGELVEEIPAESYLSRDLSQYAALSPLVGIGLGIAAEPIGYKLAGEIGSELGFVGGFLIGTIGTLALGWLMEYQLNNMPKDNSKKD